VKSRDGLSHNGIHLQLDGSVRCALPFSLLSLSTVSLCLSISISCLSLAYAPNYSLQLSAKNVGLFEAFYNSIKPVQVS
jgi:hypothetical protein